MDLRRILDDEPMLDVSRSDEPPQIGLMTQTITPSPVVKWILRAQIRNKDSNDVIIVRESSIELKQVVGRGLRTVAVKNDFQASIRAARILGKLKSPPSAHESERIFQERFADSGYTSDGSFMEIDGGKHVNSGSQILVLSLRCGQASRLMFLSARDDRYGRVHFISSIHALPGHRIDNARPDAHLAIDPESLAMAAAGHNDTLVLGALKSLSQIKKEMESRDRIDQEFFTPFSEQTIRLPLAAVILSMEFLQPPKDHGYNGIVLLLLIISVAGQTRIRLLEWDSSSPLSEVRDLWRAAYPVPHYARNLSPSQLIPTANYCGFILTFDKFMLAYKYVSSGYNKPLRIEYPQEQGEKPQSLYEFGRPGQRRYWTAWARPYRHGGFSDKKQDALYLGREDGLVSFMMFSSETGHSERHEIGRVHISIDSGFESLDSGEHAEYNSSDLLLMAGNSSDGGLFQYYPRKMTGLRPSKLRNWTPLLDWTTIPAKITPSVPALCDPLGVNAGRMFACAGYGMRHGKLCEIRCGIEASCISEISLGHIAVNRPTQVWLLPVEVTSRSSKSSQPRTRPAQSREQSSQPKARVTLLLSGPGHGSELAILDDRGELMEPQPQSPFELLIDVNAQTLAASVTADGLAVQITEGSIRVMSVRGLGTMESLITESTQAPVSRAFIDGRTSACLLTLRKDNLISIQSLRLEPGETRPDIVYSGTITGSDLQCGVSSLSMHSASEQQFAIVGLADGKLRIYLVGLESMEFLVEHHFAGASAICESICCLQWTWTETSLPEIIIICGLRNGTLHVLRCQHQKDHSTDDSKLVSLRAQRELQVGQSAVWVFPDFTSNLESGYDPGAIIVVCRDTISRLIFRDRECSRVSLHRIWICYPDTRCVPSSPIFAFGQASSWLRRSHPSGTVCYVDEKSVRVLNIEQSRFASMIPRPIKLNGTPRRVQYASSIDQLIVATEELVVIPGRLNPAEKAAGGRQFLFSKLQVIDVDAEVDALGNSNEVHVGLSGDHISALLEWHPEFNGRRWPLLVATTIRKELEGCIYIYRMDRQLDGPTLKLVKEIPRIAPVHSVVAMGATRLAYGCGDRLEVIELGTSDKGFIWSQPSHLQVQLDSPARALSSYEDKVFVSTTEHSHLICSMLDGKLTVLFTDYKTRHGLDHMYLGPDPDLLTGCDSLGGVHGFWWSEKAAAERKMRLAFEVNLHDPISRLCQAKSLQSQQAALNLGVTPTMLGVSVGGAIYSFDIVAAPKWHLLRFVQNLLDRQPAICPATYMDNEHRHVNPGTGPEHKHINGDILHRLLEQLPTGAEYLRRIMEAPPRSVTATSFSTDFETAKARMSCFNELVHAAFPEFTSADPYVLVVDYLDRILRSVY